LYGHGLVPKVDYDAWLTACAPGNVQALSCVKASIKVLHDSQWDGQNIDALDYPACDASGASVAERVWLRERGMGSIKPAHSRLVMQEDGTPDLPYDPCVDNYAMSYLNRCDAIG